MPKTQTPGRTSVTSDPDRGVAVNSGTDPQRPGTPARPVPETSPPGMSAEETSATSDRFNATHRPASTSRGENVEGGGSKGDPDEAL
ncbi:MAG: hypothetical protein DMF77_17815 [Acidobacteria bacterium]|nr:MAG: hypothetical protein DMF77_17815 [Acidobacteriota bacterium]